MTALATHHASHFSGMILYRRNYRDNGLLIKFLTKEFGIKTFLVHGARKPKYKLKAAILPFSYGEYIGDIKDTGLSYLNDAVHVRQYQGISEDIVENAYATYIMGLIDEAFHEDVPLGIWYDRLEQGLTLINQGLTPSIIANIFEIQLLPEFGVAPELRQCAICSRTDLPFDYSEAYGGLICQLHFDRDPHRMQLDQRTIYYLRQFSVIDLFQINSISVAETTTAMLRKVLDKIYSSSVGINLKSKQFIDQMSQWDSQMTPRDN